VVTIAGITPLIAVMPNLLIPFLLYVFQEMLLLISFVLYFVVQTIKPVSNAFYYMSRDFVKKAATN
jgi:hypothetical protein